MLDYSEVMSRLADMRSRFDDGFSSSDRLFIRDMSVAILGRPVRNTSCKDCYRDAYLEIMHKLKNLGTMPKEKKFSLRAGVLLHYAGEVYVNDNLTDEIAMDALNDNMNRIDLFQKTPDNLEEILTARKAVKAQEQPADDTPKEELVKEIAALKAVNAEQEEKLQGAEKTFKAKDEEIATLKDELQKSKDEAKAEVERLNAEIKAKDEEIATLKATSAEAPAAPAAGEKKEEAAPAAAAEGAAEAGKTAKPAAAAAKK